MTHLYHLAQGWENFIDKECLGDLDDRRVTIYVAKDKDSRKLVTVTAWKGVITNKDTERLLFKKAEILCNACCELSEKAFDRPLCYWSKDQIFYLASDHSPDYKSLDQMKIDDNNGNHRIVELDKVEMVHLVCFLIDAVHALHKLGIHHGSIGPCNILMISNNNQEAMSNRNYQSAYSFKLTCTISSLIPNSSTEDATLPPPEILYSEAYDCNTNPTFSKDIWCVGMTLFQLAVGFQPSSDVNNKKLLTKFLRGQADLESEVLSGICTQKKLLWWMQNPWVRSVILRCLAVKVSERVTAAQLANCTTFRAIRELLPFLHSSSSASSSWLTGEEEVVVSKGDDDNDEIDLWQDLSHDQTNNINDENSQNKLQQRRVLAGVESYLKVFGGNQAAFLAAVSTDADAQQQQVEKEPEEELQTPQQQRQQEIQDYNQPMMPQDSEDAEEPQAQTQTVTNTMQDKSIISPKYFDNDLAQAEEIKRTKRPRSILKSTTNPNLNEEMNKLRTSSFDPASTSTRRVRSREPTANTKYGWDVMFLDDIRSLHRLFDKGKLPKDCEGFWEALKRANNNWRRFPCVKRNLDCQGKDLIYTNVMGLKEDNYLRYQQCVDYFCGSEQFLAFVIEQCRLKGNEDGLVEFIEGIISKKAGDEDDARSKSKGDENENAWTESSNNSWRNKRRRSI